MKKLLLCFLVLLSAFTSFAIGSITGVSSVCQGHTTVLADTSVGGSWSSSNVAVATVGSTGVVTGVSVGSTIISYRIGSSFSTFTIAVNGNPSVITGTREMCVFSETLLTDTVAGGAWTSSAAAVATVFASGPYGIVNGMSAGTAMISYTLSTGCYAVASVTVAAMPGHIIAPVTICTGDTIILTDTPGGGRWTSSDTTIATIGATTGVLIGLTAGVAEITYAISAACPTTTFVELFDTATILRFASPVVCVGGSLLMEGDPFGGTWSGSGATATIGSVTGAVTGIATGIDVITYSLGGRCRSTDTIHIVTSIPPVTGTPLACVSSFGGSFLSDSVTGGTWSSSNYSIVSVGGGYLDGFSPGTATITYSIGGSCIATIIATVLPSPVITAPPVICVGTSVMLTDSLAGGHWNSPTTFTASLSSTGVITGLAPGYAYISYTVDSFCRASTEIHVIAGVTPIHGTADFCMNTQSLLIDSIAGGIWTSTNAGIAIVGSTGMLFGAEEAVISGVSAGTDTIMYSFAPGCEAVFAITIYPCNNAVNNVPGANTEIKLYPSPALETLNIEVDPDTYRSLSVYDETGRLMISRPIGSPLTSLDVSGLPGGIYLISFQGIKGNTVTKFVKSE